jgi:cytoskeletal protein CcmA (bactofilin family)
MPTELLEDRGRPLPAGANGAAPSTISKALTIVGDLIAQGDLHLEGELRGSIQCSGTVFVASGGQASAVVKADGVIVLGSLSGSVEASNQIDIRKSASLTGDVKCARINIEDGAYFKGRINIQRRPTS